VEVIGGGIARGGITGKSAVGRGSLRDLGVLQDLDWFVLAVYEASRYYKISS
jgi:hypothetical protein